MRIRNVIQEFEAHLHPVSPSKAHGKSEWKQYGDGTYRFKVSVREVSLPDGTQIDLLLDDVRIERLTTQNNKAKVDIENPLRTGIPNVRAGQVLQVRFRETILAKGTYEAE